MKKGFRCSRRLPRQIAAIRIFPNATKKIYSPTLTLLRFMNPMVPRDAHRNRDAILFDAGCRRHLRVEFPIYFTLLRRPKDRYVQPFAGWRGLKLNISFDEVRIGR